MLENLLEQMKSVVYFSTANADNLPCVKGPGFDDGYICFDEGQAEITAALMNIAFEEGKKINNK